MTVTGNMFNSIAKNDDRHVDKIALTHAKIHTGPDDSWIFPSPTSTLKNWRRPCGKNTKPDLLTGREQLKEMLITNGLSQEWRKRHAMATPENMERSLASLLISKCIATIISIVSQLQLMMQIKPS